MPRGRVEPTKKKILHWSEALPGLVGGTTDLNKTTPSGGKMSFGKASLGGEGADIEELPLADRWVGAEIKGGRGQ